MMQPEYQLPIRNYNQQAVQQQRQEISAFLSAVPYEKPAGVPTQQSTPDTTAGRDTGKTGIQVKNITL